LKSFSLETVNSALQEARTVKLSEGPLFSAVLARAARLQEFEARVNQIKNELGASFMFKNIIVCPSSL